MTDRSNVIPFPTDEPRNPNALIVEILQEIADDNQSIDWPARLEEWATEHWDPWQELSKFGVMALLLHASALIETRGEAGLDDYIAHARNVWPGVAQ